MGSDAMIYTRRFMKFVSSIQKLVWGEEHRHINIMEFAQAYRIYYTSIAGRVCFAGVACSGSVGHIMYFIPTASMYMK
jgi:hypothetical protein